MGNTQTAKTKVESGVEDAACGDAKVPRTERGRRTLRKLLDAAAEEFGEKGFHEASVSSITRRAGVALGSFYTYFDSKDALFRALVADMSEQVKSSARSAISEGMGALEIERAGLLAFLNFAAEHKEVYRIIDEAEFVDPASYRDHYETIAARFVERLQAGAARGEFRDGLGEIEAWAMMGMNVFAGLRFAVWGLADKSPEEVAAGVNRLLAEGLLRR
ncbi:AcrR family transcriptional regulator [Erythromicrobium ramosum]|uniref:AcrR family transcriptional regulator n=1 Tax=Erythrobacter ramosus TaxID=35811 RepID=A0A6I4UCX6_9SPHN|nr:TetR/AcrR family transcriptional regulator [Erythrobacter ramosus]MBB3775337.1 AcrR family transcriptional regulator [Erythrobacter ramosus]MXP37041.1 TetR family transcriptional regulator [Erythrobacter ramosus]